MSDMLEVISTNGRAASWAKEVSDTAGGGETFATI
jgi:hypothetical protein